LGAILESASPCASPIVLEPVDYFRWQDFMQMSYSVLQVFPE